MTREEITKRIEEIEDARFLLKMKDRWSTRDFETDRRMFQEVFGLQKKLAAMGS